MSREKSWEDGKPRSFYNCGERDGWLKLLLQPLLVSLEIIIIIIGIAAVAEFSTCIFLRTSV